MVDIKDIPWWQKGIVYQVYPRSFKDSNNDGIGDLSGISEKLDHIRDLGVDAIWISPFYPSPMADFGYDVADYVGIDPMFGTMADFDHLLEQAHARQLKLIVDFVPNHSSDQHPWFLESRSSRDNPKRDWYIWAEAKSDGSPPNNWLSVFGGPAWTWDEKTGQYYMHSFLKEQPDLNWRSPEVREAMFDVMRFWLGKGVDGVRIDVIFAIFKDELLRDNPVTSWRGMQKKSLGDYDNQEHIYDKNRPEVHGVLRDLRRLFDSYGDRVLIGETHVFDWETLMPYYGQGDELHIPFNFTLVYQPWDAGRFRETIDSYEAALPPGAWPNYVLGCHDDHRVATRYGESEARTAAMLLLTLRGTPTLYYGEEIGMTDVDVPPDKIQDPWGKQVAGLNVGRDPNRTPMQWDTGPNAGFTGAEVEPWLPVAPDYQSVNVETEQNDPKSMLALYQRLIALRKSSPALQIGRYRPLDNVPKDCFIYLREHGHQRFLIALNFSAGERQVSLGTPKNGRHLLSTYLDGDGPVDLNNLSLRANEGVIVDLDYGS